MSESDVFRVEIEYADIEYDDDGAPTTPKMIMAFVFQYSCHGTEIDFVIEPDDTPADEWLDFVGKIERREPGSIHTCESKGDVSITHADGLVTFRSQIVGQIGWERSGALTVKVPVEKCIGAIRRCAYELGDCEESDDDDDDDDSCMPR